MIGIVASRLVERYHRPVVLIAGTARRGDWKGSGRSIPAFDLHAGLAACAEHLERFGGHRAAAGLSIRPEEVDELAEAFAAHADAHLDDDDLRPVTPVDAIVPGSALTLGLCAELRRLAPFGLGNPGVNLLVAGCELTDLATVGEGKHLRFRVRDRGRPAGSAIAFGLGSQLDRFRRVGAYDVAFRLQENTWNGTTSPQLVVRRIFETPDRYLELRERFAAEWRSSRLSPEAEEIVAELGLGRRRGSLAQPARVGAFRALLEEPPELAAGGLGLRTDEQQLDERTSSSARFRSMRRRLRKACILRHAYRASFGGIPESVRSWREGPKYTVTWPCSRSPSVIRSSSTS